MTPSPHSAAILTVSDRCANGEATDTAGPALRARLESRGYDPIEQRTVADETDQIRDAIAHWINAGIALVTTTGGTGFAPRDRTPEAVAPLLERRADGLMERARSTCSAATPFASLSRGIAGITDRTLIITLPGSERGAVETLDAIADLLPHAIKLVRSEPTSHPRPKSQQA